MNAYDLVQHTTMQNCHRLSRLKHASTPPPTFSPPLFPLLICGRYRNTPLGQITILIPNSKLGAALAPSGILYHVRNSFWHGNGHDIRMLPIYAATLRAVWEWNTTPAGIWWLRLLFRCCGVVVILGASGRFSPRRQNTNSAMS
jgi:hypothetical protein